jgi:beta-mannosidase
MGRGAAVRGALVWQMNDYWPTSLWVIVDYHPRRKPAFYTVKRALQPLVAGVQREHHDWSVCHARPAKVSKYSVCVTSSLRRGSTLDVELRFVSIDSGEDIKPAITKAGLTMPDNGSVTAITGQIDNRTNEAHVLAVSFSRDGAVISRDVDPPQPFKYLSFENRGVQVQADEGSYEVSIKRPMKGIVSKRLMALC